MALFEMERPIKLGVREDAAPRKTASDRTVRPAPPAGTAGALSPDRLRVHYALEKPEQAAPDAIQRVRMEPRAVVSPYSPGVARQIQAPGGLGGNEVLQLYAHSEFGDRQQVNVPAPVPPAPAPPVMVYETFGNNVDQLVSIYNQSCLYPGRTICILGFNQRYRISQYGAGAIPPAQPLIAALHPQANHEVYIVPFKWKAVGGHNVQLAEDNAFAHPPPGQTGEQAAQAAAIAANHQGGGYDFPYYEVRAHLMGQAQEIVDNLEIENPLFRWIDRDVTHDSSAVISDNPHKINILQNIANSFNPMYVTGTYNWLPLQQPIHHQHVLPRLNQFEHDLRQYWHRLNRKYNLNSQHFYLPEPLLIMNSLAHIHALNKLRTEAAPNKIHEDSQAGESMKAFSGNDSVGNVKFLPNLTASKPVKPGYLRDLQLLIDQQGNPNIDAVCTALKNTRQSVFNNGHWAFITTADYTNWDQENARDTNRIEVLEAKVTDHTITVGEKNELAQRKFNVARFKLANQIRQAF